MIDETHYEIDKAIESTKRSIADGQKVIFEATACSLDGAYSRIDVLQKVTGTKNWDLIEAKQSTEVNDFHLDDI